MDAQRRQRQKEALRRMDKILADADVGAIDMVKLLETEYSEATIEETYTACCEELPKEPITPQIIAIGQAIDDLGNMMPNDLVKRCKDMEDGYKEKCDEIKRQRYLMRKMINGVETAEVGTQVSDLTTIVTQRTEHTTSVKTEIVKKEMFEEEVVNKDYPVVSNTVSINRIETEVPIQEVTYKLVERKVDKEVIKTVEKEQITKNEKIVKIPITNKKIEVIKIEKPVVVINKICQVETVSTDYYRVVQKVTDKYVDIPYNTVKINFRVTDKFEDFPYYVEHLNVIEKRTDFPIIYNRIKPYEQRKSVPVDVITYVPNKIEKILKKTVLNPVEIEKEIAVENVTIKYEDEIYYRDVVKIRRVEKKVPYERVVVKIEYKPVTVYKEELEPFERIIKKQVERVTYKPVEKFNDVQCESITNKINTTIEDYNVDFVVDIEQVKIQQVESVIEVPITNTTLKFTEEQVPIEKTVWTEKIVNKIVTMEEFQEVEQKFAVNVINTKYQILNKIVEKFVEIEDENEGDDEKGKEKCMTSSSFIKVWNALMKIKFSDNEISDACLSDEKFIELIVSNLSKNMQSIKNEK